MDGRARMLVMALPLIALLMLVSTAWISAQPGNNPLEVAFIAGSALALVLVAVLFRLGRLAYNLACTAALALVASVMVERILRLFLGGWFDLPERPLFMPVFSSLPVLYLMAFVLLPLRSAESVAVAMWLPISLLITWLSVPYWDVPAKRHSLIWILCFVWIGNGIYLLLFATAGRRQLHLVERHAQLARRERELRHVAAEGEARLRQVFDLASVGINVTDPQGRYLMVNPRMAEMLGYTPEELVGMHFRDVTAPEEVATDTARVSELVDGRLEELHFEKRYRRKDGRIVHAEIRMREIEHEANAERRFLCVAVDLTERKQAEAQAAEHRRIRDFHFEHTPLAVVEWGPDMRVRRWSKRAEQMFGWSENEAVGRTGEELAIFPPAQIEARSKRVDRMFSGEQNHGSAIVPMLHRSGRPLWSEIHNAAIRGQDGQVQTLVSMALDITESQDMLYMLNESEARFRSIFNQAAVGMALLDADGRWLNVNQRLCEITGYGMDELLLIDFQSITHPDDLERDLHMARALMDRTIDHYEMEKRYIRADGKVTWAMLYVRRLDATGDIPDRFVSVLECIDERKAAEERVRALTASLESRVAERTVQLRDIIQAGQRRNEELTLINDMGRLLSAATNMQEAGQVVTRYLPRIFPLADGALYLAGHDKARFERQAHWGEARVGAPVFETTECWALRRGEPHHVEGEPDALH
ncbi:MAG: PAS domain-containing protein, partial [Panacagrimonas sp.]